MQVWNPSVSFVRPNDSTAYSPGDLVANSTTPGSVTPLSFPLGGNSMPGTTHIARVRLSKSGTATANAAFRAHFYGASPTVANGDNGVWSTDQAANYLGAIDVTSMKAFTDGCAEVGAAAAGAEMLIRLPAGATVFALLEARGAYAPAANETFTLALESLEAY
jgi:hypothetical protein